MNGFERRRERKKKDILEATLELFMKHGVRKVSIAEIADRASVSQVTIYNYFGSKDQLIYEVIIYYVDKIWGEYDRLFKSKMPFPDKIKRIIFDKKQVANQISGEFLEYIMEEYSAGSNYIEKVYQEKALPQFMELFEVGKAQGYIDQSISNEAILLYIKMFKEYMQQEDVIQNILPITEDFTKLFFFGIAGKSEDTSCK
ncbi:MAG TPA: TetR/AcrR family transcriptional regulator [Cerasibacillus sp.]|uniref:TetR/AcrR family transcriptional regulator n=1 Tax=Cerasibacillus sp. TaxID=2498711 RepID=UPI002F42A680